MCCIFNFEDIEKFFRYFQIKRNYRDVFETIKLDFVYDLTLDKLIINNLSKIGSDVPACFLSKNVKVSGTGEILQPIKLLNKKKKHYKERHRKLTEEQLIKK